MMLVAPADSRSPLEYESGDQRASQSRNSRSYAICSAFMLGMLVATLGLLTVQHYGLGDASLMKSFFAPTVPRHYLGRAPPSWPQQMPMSLPDIEDSSPPTMSSDDEATIGSPHLQGSIAPVTRARKSDRISSVQMVFGKSYKPRWKKQQTLAEVAGDIDPIEKGLTGTIPIVFKCGNDTISAVANPGDSIRDVAFNAGQYIRYGCGKGECGTCQAKVNGKWMKPCIDVVPADIAVGDSLVIEVRAVKSKAKSSGKFYSFRSFCMGAYNNILGMVGFVKRGGAAQKNLQARLDYEALVAKKAAEKKAARLQQKNSVS